MYRLEKYWVNKRDETENEPTGNDFGAFATIEDAWNFANTHKPKAGLTYEIISPSGRLTTRLGFDWE